MMTSSYWSETGGCGNQQHLPQCQPPQCQLLQCQPAPPPHVHRQQQCQAQAGEKNVVYERVRTYSGPANKVAQALDPLGSPRDTLSPLHTASSLQNLVWTGDHPQEVQSPTMKVATCTPATLHITHNTEQDVFLRGANFIPGNNVIYEKTIRKVEKLNPEECYPKLQCQRQVVQQCVQAQHGGQHGQVLAGSGSASGHAGTDPWSGGRLGQTHLQSTSLQEIDSGPEKLDPKYFGELLAELSRKNTDLYRCLLQHVQKIGGRKQDFGSETEDVESLIPKGLSEFTKQQLRYILQMIGTSEKSHRLVLSTFSSLREELGHLQHDLTALENDKITLEKSLAFKDTQIKEYEALLASVRANNRQQQQGLQDSNAKCRELEETILSLRHSQSDAEYRLKELEYGKRNLEQENKNLRIQVADTCTGPMLQAKIDEISSHYMEMVKNLRMEKDREICKLRTQINQFQKDVSRREGSCSDFQIKLHELTSMLEEKNAVIKRQMEELSRLRQEISSSSSSHQQSLGCSKKTFTTTRKYRTQYPILGLLYDDYEYIPPGKDRETIVIENTEDKWICP
uniref:POF1B actin binding protein n=1 Tax=Ornithorhynchus anatinus TaxID=9258 RepID=A0A6I8N890_ORNAN